MMNAITIKFNHSQWSLAQYFNESYSEFKNKAQVIAHEGRSYQILSKQEILFYRHGKMTRLLFSLIYHVGLLLKCQLIAKWGIRNKQILVSARLIDLTQKETYLPSSINQASVNHANIEVASVCPQQTKTSIDNPSFSSFSSEIVQKPPSLEMSGSQPRQLPEIVQGIIKNGYGEYLIYRITPEGEKKTITDKEYEEIFNLIEDTRSLEGGWPVDFHAYLRAKIQGQLGKEVEIAFIPRTLYEMIFLKECIEEEINRKQCCNVHETHIGLIVRKEISEEQKKQRIQKVLEEKFWQQSLFQDKDYINPLLDSDYRNNHLIKVAAKLNQIALNLFKTHAACKEGFTYEEICVVQNDTLAFLKIYLILNLTFIEEHGKCITIRG